MRLDPPIAALLDQMAADGAPELHQLGLDGARAMPDNLIPLGGPAAEAIDDSIAFLRGVLA